MGTALVIFARKTESPARKLEDYVGCLKREYSSTLRVPVFHASTFEEQLSFAKGVSKSHHEKQVSLVMRDPFRSMHSG
jgi:hypothetical protein